MSQDSRNGQKPGQNSSGENEQQQSRSGDGFEGMNYEQVRRPYHSSGNDGRNQWESASNDDSNEGDES